MTGPSYACLLRLKVFNRGRCWTVQIKKLLHLCIIDLDCQKKRFHPAKYVW